MITADQLLCHLIGDYILQSHWMAQFKVMRMWVAIYHAFFYTLPFLFLGPSAAAVAVILVSHAVIDRYRLAKWINGIKNYMVPFTLAPLDINTVFEPPNEMTGYPESVPYGLGLALLIVTDNIIHIIINGVALWAL